MEEEHKKLMLVYVDRLRSYTKRFLKRQKKQSDPLMHIRALGRRASEGLIGFKHSTIFPSEPKHEQIDDLKIRKRYMKDDLGELDHVPPLPEQLHHSMVWERYNLEVEDEVDQNAKVAADLNQYKFVDARELVYGKKTRRMKNNLKNNLLAKL